MRYDAAHKFVAEREPGWEHMQEVSFYFQGSSYIYVYVCICRWLNEMETEYERCFSFISLIDPLPLFEMDKIECNVVVVI